MSILLPDDLARDLGLMLAAGWFVASLQKSPTKAGPVFLVNATKDPAWKLLLTYDPARGPVTYRDGHMYRNEDEFIDLDRDGLLRAIVQPEVITGRWETLPDDGED